MLRRLPALLLLFMLVFSGACIPSLHKFYSDEALAPLPAIEGRWGEPGESGFYQFDSPAESGAAFRMLIKEDDEVLTHSAHVFRLDDQYYLDVYPEDPGKLPYSGYGCIPTHYAIHLKMNQDQLSLFFMQPEAVEDLLKTDPAAVAHELVEENGGGNAMNYLLLTAPTDELQRFLRQHHSAIYTSSTTLQRLPVPHAQDESH